MSQKYKESECRSSKDVLQALAECQVSESVASTWVKAIAGEREPVGNTQDLQSPHEGTDLLSSLARPRKGLPFKHLPDPDNTQPLSQANYGNTPTSPTSYPEKERKQQICRGKERGEQKRVESNPLLPFYTCLPV